MHRLLMILSFMICLAVALPCAGRPDSTTTSGSTDHIRPPKQPAKSTWERIVSFPGTVVYYPFKLVFKATSWCIATGEKTHLAQRYFNGGLAGSGGRFALDPTYSSRTGAGMRLHWNGMLNRESRIIMSMSVGLHWRRRFGLAISNIAVWDGLMLHLTGTWQLLTNEAYYGIGPDSKVSDEARYGHQYGALSVKFSYPLDTTMQLWLDAGLEKNRIQAAIPDKMPSIYKMSTPPTGLETIPKLGHIGVKLADDTRDVPGQPHSGYELEVYSSLYDEMETHDYGFFQLGADYTHYVHLFHHRTLALRGAIQMVRAYSARTIPFYYLSELGYRETIRGFERGRFHDRDRLFITSEYRFPIRRNAYSRSGYDGLLFIDVGQVTPNLLGQIKIDRFQPGVGGGVLIYDKNGVVIRAEIGFSKDGFRTYFSLN